LIIFFPTKISEEIIFSPMISKDELSKLSHEEKDELIFKLIATIETLTVRVEKLEALQEENNKLREDNKRLREENKELRERLNKNSSNSSKPPSSDGFNKQNKNRSQRRKSNKKSGGQPKHKGHNRAMVDVPDKVFAHELKLCPHCQSEDLVEKKQNYKARQIHDIVPSKLEVTEHQCIEYLCLNCIKTVHPSFPKEATAPVTYGPELKALVIYLKNYQLLPYNRIKELLFDQYAISISEGTIANIEKQATSLVSKSYEDIKDYLSNVSVLHSDETGVQVNASLFWNHVYSNHEATFFSTHKKRGSEAMNEIGILEQYTGTVIHDFWSSYYSFIMSTHGACNAHILRELTADFERGTVQADKMSKLLLKIKEEVDASQTSKLTDRKYLEFRAKYRSIIRSAIRCLPPPERTGKRGRPKKGKSLCLWERLRDYEGSILLFSKESAVPFDNNQAERDLRMYKVKMKVSGCFRSEESANDFSIIRSVISTIKKQGRSVMSDLRKYFQGQIPVILPE